MNKEFSKEAVLALIEEKMYHYDEYEDAKEFNVLYDICKEVNEMEVKTMDDSISRQAALGLARDICIPTKDGSIYRHKCIDPDAIRELPPAQPERKNRQWVKHDTGHSIYYDCSLCGCVAPCTEVSDSFIWKLSTYCPDCAAKMER